MTTAANKTKNMSNVAAAVKAVKAVKPVDVKVEESDSKQKKPRARKVLTANTNVDVKVTDAKTSDVKVADSKTSDVKSSDEVDSDHGKTDTTTTTNETTTNKKRVSRKNAKADTKKPRSASVKVPRAKTPKTTVRENREKTETKTDEVKKRVHVNKPTSLDSTGIGIAPPRVKVVLYNQVLNKNINDICVAIAKAENKPKKAKPTKENPDPETKQEAQTHVKDLPSNIREVIDSANAEHLRNLREAYERKHVESEEFKHRRADYDPQRKQAELTHRQNVKAQYEAARLDAMPKEMRKNYDERRAAFMKDKVETPQLVSSFNKSFCNCFYEELGQFMMNHRFDAESFNKSFQKTFYDGLNAYLAENNTLTLTYLKQKDGKPSTEPKYNEWSLAQAIVKKRINRVSKGSRYIIACFLDRLVEQYAHNGLHNCLLAGKKIVQLYHAIDDTDANFSKRVSMHNFVKTFNNYSYARNFCESVKENHEKNKQLKADGKEPLEKPQFKNAECDVSFESYIDKISRSVKTRLALTHYKPEDKLEEFSISNEFKRFCSYIVYEAIVRIGHMLKTEVSKKNSKTITDSAIWKVLEQIHNACGVDFTYVRSTMRQKLSQNNAYQENRKNTRKTEGDATVEGDVVADATKIRTELKKAMEDDDAEEVAVYEDE